VTRIRLVIASPGDVTPERDAVEKVCGELNRLLGRSSDFAIDVYRWETDSGPGFHVKGPQGKIDQDLPISSCDIMVAIFWTRFGSPTLLPGGETGTEHEISIAFESWKKKQKPQILIYFKKEAVDWDQIDTDQIARVKKFQKEFRPGGRYGQGLCEDFKSIDEFKDKLRQHLSGYLPSRGIAAPSSGFDFDGYRTRFGYAPKWDLSNIGVAQAPGDAPVSPTLEQIYQELRIAEKFDPGQLSLGAPLSADDVAVLEERVLLIGAAGAGKTTWVRHVFYRLLQRSDVCPFLIELRKLAETLQHRNVTGKARSLVSYLEATLEELDCKAEGLEDALKDHAGPRPILLVDGWDELGGLGQEFRQKLASFVRSYPRIGVIATSRPYGLEKPDATDGFTQRYVQPLNDEEIEAFSNRFWAVCYGADPKHAESAQRFLAALKSAPSAKILARTPLLCTMMLFISRSRTLPDERHDLYQACIEHMLSAYRREEAHVPGMAHHWRPEKMNERLRAAAGLAFATHTEAKEEQSQTIVLSAKRMSSLLPDDCREQGPGFLAWLSGPAGLLTDRSDGSLSFAHLSFQEYLAAWHIANVLPEDRQLFDQWAGLSRWQEVLRLWAAIMWSGRRERFAVVAERFLESSAGLCALGGMLADGWGTQELFRLWLERFLVVVETRPPSEVSNCGSAWAGCRQTQRREEFQDAWNRAATNWKWFARMRAESFSSEAGLELPPSTGQTAVVLARRGQGVASERRCALGRVWTFATPAWPEEPWKIALCHVWPSSRRVLGMRVQTFLTLLDGDAWTGTSAASFSLATGKSSPGSRIVERKLAKAFALPMRKILGHLSRTGQPRNRLREYFASSARDWAGYAARYLEPLGNQLNPGDLWQTHFSNDIAWYRTSRVALSWKPDGESSLSASFSRKSAHEFVHLVHSLAGDPTKSEPELKSLFNLAGKNPMTADLALVEGAALGRGAARSRLAYLSPSPDAAVNLISVACRESLNPGKHSNELRLALNSYTGDPLWRALARHLARLSTDADRELLIDLAHHPEKREPPLRWGLQFIVRGDVMMPDDSIRPLDDFFVPYGLPAPPYLEEMPEELPLMNLLPSPEKPPGSSKRGRKGRKL
jgi:hypothetical protein